MTEVLPEATGIVASQALVPQAVPFAPSEVCHVTFVTPARADALPVSEIVDFVTAMTAAAGASREMLTAFSCPQTVIAARRIMIEVQIFFMIFLSTK